MSTTSTSASLTVSSSGTETAASVFWQAFCLLREMSAVYPQSSEVTDAAGTCIVGLRVLSEARQNVRTPDSEDMAKELGELEKCAKLLDGMSSETAVRYREQLRSLIADIAAALMVDMDRIDSYSETRNITQGERTEAFRQFISAENAEADAKQFLADSPKIFSPETTRGEKIINDIYALCGVIQDICDGLDQQEIVWCNTIKDTSVATFIKIGRMLELLERNSLPFIEKYLPDITLAEFKALYAKLKNRSAYDQVTSDRVIELNQEIAPIRMLLARHTGEEATKQDSVINNYDQMVDIYKRDLDSFKSNQHPMVWITGILIAVRLALLSSDTWPATWIGLLSLLLFAVPFAVLWRRDFESLAKQIDIEYPDVPDYWVTRTHLNDRILETRKGIITRLDEALEDRRKARRWAERIWAIAIPAVISANIFSSVF